MSEVTATPASRLGALAHDLEATLRLTEDLIREIRRDGVATPVRMREIADQLADRSALSGLPSALLTAYGEITAALGGIRLSREALEAQAIDRLHHTHAALAEVSTATETAATAMLDGLDRTLALIEQLAADPADGRNRSTTCNALREEVNGLFGYLQFQDIITQRLQGAAELLAEVERRLAAVADLFKAPETPEAVPPAGDVPSEASKPRSFDPDASIRDREQRQAVADSVIRAVRDPVVARSA